MGIDEEYVKKKLKGIGKDIDKKLPNGFGFALLTFKFDADADTTQLMYVANANREDIVKAMEEFIEKTKTNFGNDTNKY